MKYCKINGKICNLNNLKQLNSRLATLFETAVNTFSAAWVECGLPRPNISVFCSDFETVIYQNPYQCVVKGPRKPPTLVEVVIETIS